jgi:hypothetical protein
MTPTVVENLYQELQALEKTLQQAQEQATQAQQVRLHQLQQASARVNALSDALSAALKDFAAAAADWDKTDDGAVDGAVGSFAPGCTPPFEPTRHGVRAGRQHPVRRWQASSCRLPRIYWQGDHCWLTESPLWLEQGDASRQRQQRQALEAWLVQTRRRILNDFSGL